MMNLKQAVRELPCALVFDNDDLRMPFRLAAIYKNGQPALLIKPIPGWLAPRL
jgi:hypothetical protein